ncbi:hypothetical protein U0070_000464 [Myodes glareolus]|uniref:Uncharacterized protein n=1 Tax=Myodes glareolus TaxID=447135 RepID=A0AAW0IQW9_MYOGA
MTETPCKPMGPLKIVKKMMAPFFIRVPVRIRPFRTRSYCDENLLPALHLSCASRLSLLGCSAASTLSRSPAVAGPSLLSARALDGTAFAQHI